MNITSVTQLNNGSYLVVCDEGNINVLEAPENRHYQAMLEWIENGGEIEIEPELPTPVPQVVTRFQARAVLYQSGLFPAIDAFMADPETDMLVKLAWTDAQEFKRDSPTLLAVASALSLTEEQLDNMFIQAATISA